MSPTQQSKIFCKSARLMIFSATVSSLSSASLASIPQGADLCVVVQHSEKAYLIYMESKLSKQAWQQVKQVITWCSQPFGTLRYSGKLQLTGCLVILWVLLCTGPGWSGYSFDPVSGPEQVFSSFFGTSNPYEALNGGSAMLPCCYTLQILFNCDCARHLACSNRMACRLSSKLREYGSNTQT